jgi:hypothetical protein
MDTRSIPKARRLRAKLTLHGHTYKSFATARGFNPRSVKAAARGERNGKTSKQIAAAILSL